MNLHKSNLSGDMSAHNLDEFLILNVDDTDAARYAKSKILTRAGFRVIEAKNGTEALIRAKEAQPNLILLDTKMPDINGFEVCRQLKKDPATQPISILQTSASFITTEDKIIAIEFGADNYLIEPIEPEELIANIKALVRLNLAESELRKINVRKDVFLATLAHELRNPLGPIRNSIKLLETLDGNLSPEQHKLLNIITRQTNQMVRLVDDLLDVSRISLGKISLQSDYIDVAEFIEAAVECSGNFIRDRGHELKVSINAQNSKVYGDKVRLVQIVSNLLTNAAKFTPFGGLITINVEQIENDVIINVTDNGIGLTKQNLNSIFDLFVQHGRVDDKAQEGLGIGLSLVKNLTELHGGEIYVDSLGPNKGSIFTLKLKVVDAPLQDRKKDNYKTRPVEISKILVIDDNEDAASTLADLLSILGHEVQTEFTGKGGLALAKIFQPDVIFLDIGLPDLTGYEVAQHIRHDDLIRKCYLIALTGYGTENDQLLAKNAGFDLHLTKPLDYQKIQTIKLGF